MENLRIKIQAELRKYINDKHNQDECSGFIDGIDAVFELLKSEGYKDINTSEPQLPLGGVSGQLKCDCGGSLNYDYLDMYYVCDKCLETK